MKHQVFGKKLNRDVKERKALFKGLILSLINFGKIRTTVAKGKAISRLVDKLVTRAKNGTNSATNQLSAFLARKDAVEKLVKEITPKLAEKKGGYTRMRKTGMRSGDRAEEVIMEWSVPEEKKSQGQKIEKKKEVNIDQKKVKKTKENKK